MIRVVVNRDLKPVVQTSVKNGELVARLVKGTDALIGKSHIQNITEAL